MNDNKPLIETSETLEITSVETSVETPLALEPQIDEAHNQSSTCECKEWMLSVCKGLPADYEHEGKRYCVLHYPSKEKVEDFKIVFDKKKSEEDFDFRGVWFPKEVDFHGFEFKKNVNFSHAIFNAAVHFSKAIFNTAVHFSNATFSAAADFRLAKFRGKADFDSAIFNAVAYFPSATFSAVSDFRFAEFKAEAEFSFTTFSGKVYFITAIFSGEANFRAATFSEEVYFHSIFNAAANFGAAIFQETAIANFNQTKFSAEVYFSHAIFSAVADFREVTFSAVANFNQTKFKDKVNFEKNNFHENSFLNLQRIEMEKPEQVFFHSLTLRPHWFVEVNDIKKFNFTNVKWKYKTSRWMTWGKGVKIAIDKLKTYEDIKEDAYNLLSKACRQLALTEEENHRYDEASDLRYWSMRAIRLEKKQHWAFWRLDWLYWLASGYGERIRRATLILIGIWFLFAFLYTQVGFARWEPKLTTEKEAETAQRDIVGNPLSFNKAMSYSFAVMALQKPEPRPATNTAHTLVIFETVLEPLQAALLALAIRRKFMR